MTPSWSASRYPPGGNASVPGSSPGRGARNFKRLAVNLLSAFFWAVVGIRAVESASPCPDHFRGERRRGIHGRDYDEERVNGRRSTAMSHGCTSRMCCIGCQRTRIAASRNCCRTSGRWRPTADILRGHEHRHQPARRGPAGRAKPADRRAPKVPAGSSHASPDAEVQRRRPRELPPAGARSEDGVIVKYNRKTVTVVTDDQHQWNVAPVFLSRVIEASSGEARIQLPSKP